MFSCKYNKILVKKGYLYIKNYRRFIETYENASDLFKKLKESKTKKQLFDFKFNVKNVPKNECINNVLSIGSLELVKPYYDLKCVENDSIYSSNSEHLFHDTHNYSTYKINKDVIVRCFKDLVHLRTKNKNLVLFLSDSLNMILNDLEFEDVLRLIRLICGLKLNDTNLDNKLSSLYKNLLTRINVLLSQRLSSRGSIDKVENLPKYYEKNDGNHIDTGSLVDLKINHDVNELLVLWEKLSRRGDPSSRYTCTVILSLFEVDTGWIFKLDIRRVSRTLDVLLGDSKSFSKLEERFIVILLKRISNLLSNESIKDNHYSYIKVNNITPLHVKKLICNIAKITKVSPKLLESTFKLSKALQSFYNLVKLSRQVLTNELVKINISDEGKEDEVRLGSDGLVVGMNDLNLKLNKLLIKILVDCVDIIKFIDYLMIDELSEKEVAKEKYSGLSRLKSELLDFSRELLLKIKLKNEDLIVSECRSMYYLALTVLLNNDRVSNEASKYNNVLEVICNKISINTETLLESLNDTIDKAKVCDLNNVGMTSTNADVNKMSIKYLQHSLYCDKIINILSELGFDSEQIIDTNEACKRFVKEMSDIYKLFMNYSEESEVYTLIYITLLNKYNLLSSEKYLIFLSKISKIDNWDKWKSKEISMLCDLLSRTHKKYCAQADSDKGKEVDEQHSGTNGRVQILCKIKTCLNSLMDYYFIKSNIYKLGNRGFLSLISCMSTYNKDITAPGVEDDSIEELIGNDRNSFNNCHNSNILIRNEMLTRLGGMNFNQLMTLLINSSEHVDTKMRKLIVERIESLDYLTDVSKLVELDDKEIVNKVLKRHKIQIVDKRYILFEKHIKNKHLKKYGKLNYNNYTTENKYIILKNYA